jgi:hypothetical protein
MNEAQLAPQPQGSWNRKPFAASMSDTFGSKSPRFENRLDDRIGRAPKGLILGQYAGKRVSRNRRLTEEGSAE